MTTQQSVDQAKTEAFLGKVLSDTSGMTTTSLPPGTGATRR